MADPRRVCLYAGSAPGARPEYASAARAMVDALAARGLGVVYGGGRAGMMGALADAALSAGTEVIGIIPRHLADREVAHDGLTELRVVASMHERKAQMVELSDAFIALPGGLGTLEELIEVLTWAQLGLHAKPCGLLNAAGYYDPLIAFLDHAVTEGFITPASRRLLSVAGTPQELLAALVPVPSDAEHGDRGGELLA